MPPTCLLWCECHDTRVPPRQLQLRPPSSCCVIQQQLVACGAHQHHVPPGRAATALTAAASTTTPLRGVPLQKRCGRDMHFVNQPDAVGFSALCLPHACLRAQIPQAQLAAVATNSQHAVVCVAPLGGGMQHVKVGAA